MDVTAALDDLFAAPREEFVRARDELVKQARAEGQDDLVRRLRELRRPTVAAWLVNQVSRRHPADVTRLAELGAELRESHRKLAGERLRELSHQRHELVETLSGHARALAREAGQQVGNATADQVEATWTAAVASADAAEQVRAGTLSAALSGGFDDWLTAAPPTRAATPPRRTSAPKPKDQTGTRERREAEARERREAARERREAETEARQAAKARDAARQERDRAEQAAEQATATVTELREQLAEVRDRLSGATEAERAARRRATAARKAASAAENAARDAEQRLDQDR